MRAPVEELESIRKNLLEQMDTAERGVFSPLKSYYLPKD